MNTFQKYKLITESNFKNWFGKSILHTDGVPHTFYHGTGSDIEAFSHAHIGKGNDSYGAGFYFTNKPDVASGYATGHDTEAPNVIPVHLRLEKPLRDTDTKPLTRTHIIKIISSAPNHKESLSNFGDIDHEGYHKVFQGAVDAYTQIPRFQAMGTLHRDFYNNDHEKFLTNFKKITGHDGVLIKHGDHSIVNVFHPNQIKSAISSGYSPSDKLTESMDSQLTKTPVPKESFLHQMGEFSASMVGGTNFGMHKLDGSGYMIQFDKDGATELHHVDDELKGGYLKSNQPSLKLISTYKNHIKGLVDSGKKVRIVAHDALADSFHRLSKRIVAKNPGYSVTEPQTTEHEITGDKLKSWVISK